MSGAAIDTNVLVRVLIQDPTAPAQCAAARRLVEETEAAGETLFVSLCALLETEWVLRSRYKVGRASMAAAIVALLETPGIEFEHPATVEETLFLFEQHPSVDFADCLLAARALHLGRGRFLTFDAGAAQLPRAQRLAG
jgi:predicted nucleic-acid-binding protein